MTDRNLLFLNMIMNDKNETIDVCLVEKQQIPVYSFWSDTIRTVTHQRSNKIVMRKMGIEERNYTVLKFRNE
jgi:hypothetical protein